MKRLNYFLAFFFAALLFASCGGDDIVIDGATVENGSVNEDQPTTLKLSTEMEALIDITRTDEAISFDPCHQQSIDNSINNGGGFDYDGALGGPAGAPGAGGAGTTGGATGTTGGVDVPTGGTGGGTDGGSSGDVSSDSPEYVIVGGDGQELEPGVLTAGETNDLEEWDFWSDLSDEFSEFQENWTMFPRNRVSIVMRDGEGNPHIDLPIFLLNDSDEPIWTSRTDNSGSAELWINPETGVFENVRVGAVIDGEVLVYEYDSYETTGTQVYTTEESAQEAKAAEITIAFDATGSMGDELEYIKVETTDIFERVKTNNPSIDFKFASVFYRDYGDEYLEVAEPMTASEATVIDFINSQSANGGGDFPEAVHRALHLSVVDMDWQAPARTRIMFLILDAPPHGDECTVERMRVLVNESARKGIKIIPITASGIDKNTEYLMRFCALLTNGTYTYITDDSGIGNEHLDPSVDAIEVEFLNDLMVRIVNEYLQ